MSTSGNLKKNENQVAIEKMLLSLRAEIDEIGVIIEADANLRSAYINECPSLLKAKIRATLKRNWELHFEE